MGASDNFILPIQTHYLFENVLLKRKVSKIAWLGMQHPYFPSKMVSRYFPDIEQHFFDIIAENTKNRHAWDMNESGWGLMLKEEGFDLVTFFRASLHAVDSKQIVNEIKQFLLKIDGCVVFEEISGIVKNESITYTNEFGRSFVAPTTNASYLEELGKIARVSCVESIPYPPQKIVGTYALLESLGV